MARKTVGLRKALDDIKRPCGAPVYPDDPLPKDLTDEGRFFYIAGLIGNRHLTYTQLCARVMTEFEVDLTLAQMMIRDTLDKFQSKEVWESLIKSNAARLEDIYQRAMEEGNLRAATDALDKLNKLAGGYSEKIEMKGDGGWNIMINLGGTDDGNAEDVEASIEE